MHSPTRIDPLDSHQHFWRVQRGDYGWLTPALPKLYRDFDPKHLQPLLKECGIRQTVLVQAAPTIEETRFLLDLAHQHPFIAGVVGWVDLEAGNAQALEALAADSKLVGIRPMLQDIEDAQWMLKRSLAPTLQALAQRKLTFDALVRPLHLPTLLRFCERYPELKVVLDHGAKPNIAAREFDAWAADIARLAKHTACYCKLSGLVTEACSIDPEILQPYVDHLLECFGAERILWGSDWPVCETICSYQEWFRLSLTLTWRLSPEERKAVFGGTARAAYGLNEAAYAS
jgi:L-fuconolactonase